MILIINKANLLLLLLLLTESVFNVALNFGQILEALGVMHNHEIVAVSTN